MPDAVPNLFRRARDRRPGGKPPLPGQPAPKLVALPRPPLSRRLRRGVWRIIAASLLLHALILAAFWLPSEPPPELASPSGISMVFDEGDKTPTAMPGPEPTPSAPMAAPAQPSPETPPPTAAAPSQPPTPPTPTPPAPTPPAPAPPVPDQPAPSPPVPPQPQPPPQTAEPTPQTPPPPDETAAEPAPTPQPPTEAAPAIRFQSPESQRAWLTPVPIPQPLPVAPPPPPPRPVPHPPQPNNQASAFPRPMFNSLGNSLSGAIEGQREATRSGGGAPQPFAQTSGTPLGADWNALFRNWIESHKYYPEQAAQLGQQGVVTVEITIQRDGRVSDLHLVERSGSPWLDLALQSMFRDARVPAFPSGTTDPSVTYRVQMTYQLR
jgi:TonB family protein